jgi:hypothetical protein
MIDVNLVRIPTYFYWVFAVCPECGRVAYEYYHYPREVKVSKILRGGKRNV